MLVRMKKFAYILVIPVIQAVWRKGANLSASVRLELAFLLLLIGIVFLQWYSYRYKISDQEIILQRGVIKREIVHLPVSSISVITREEGILLALFGGIRYTIETPYAGKFRSDFTLYLSKRLNLFPTLHIASQPVRSYRAPNLKILLVSALSSNVFLGLLISIPIFNQIGKLLGERIQNQILDTLTWGQQHFLSFLPPLFAAVTYFLLISWLISFLFILVKNVNFHVNLYDGYLVLSRGLVVRRHTIINTQAITHAVIRQTGFLHLLGRYEIQIGCFGYGRKRGELTTLIPAEQLDTVTDWIAALPDLTYYQPEIFADPEMKYKFYKNPAIHTILFLVPIVVLFLLFPSFRGILLPLSAFPLFLIASPLFTAKLAHRRNGISPNLCTIRKIRQLTLYVMIFNPVYISGYSVGTPHKNPRKFFHLRLKIAGHRTKRISVRYLSTKNLSNVLQNVIKNGTL